MNIYKSAVNNPISTIIVFVAIAVMGLFSLTRLGVDLMPDIETNAIMVMTAYGGASAEDIENNVTKPLENSLNGVDHLKHITSASKENISVITLEFEYGTDIDVATNDVRDKLDMVTTLPDGVNTPIIFKFSTDMIPILIMGVTAEESMPGLYKILDDQVATPLARVSGVGTVSVSGIAQREIQVYCDPNKLEAYGLSIETISEAIAAANRSTPGGTFDVGSNTYSLRVDQEFDDPIEMLDIVVGHNGTAPVYLRDVARVQDTVEERTQETYNNSEKGGMIVVQKRSGANSVAVAQGVQEQLKTIMPSLPSDVEIFKIVDTSDNIISTVNSLRDTIATTFLLVMLVTFLFLGRWRATIIIVLTIPISLLSGLAYLLATGETLNIISLSSLSIAIGMVVDNAIVVLENITTHIDRGSRVKQAAMFATKEVGISVMGGTLTTIAVFLPLTMVSGMAGVLFNSLGWMVTIMLSVSTVAAITFTPVLCSLMMKEKPTKTWFQKSIDAGMSRFNNFYGGILDWCVHHRKTVITGAVVMFFAIMAGLGPKVPTEFFPVQDNARIGVTIQLPAGTAQEITRELALEISDRFREAYPEIITVNLTEGQADTDNTFASMQDNGTQLISFTVNIGSSGERERTSAEIADVVRDVVSQYPEIRRATVTEGGGGMGGASTVDVEVYGYSFDETDRIARALQEKMLESPMYTQVTLSRDEYSPELQMDFDRTKLALNGLNSSTAGAAFSAAMSGSMESYYREDGEEYDIRVRYSPEYRTRVEDLENILVTNGYGQQVRMKDLGNVVETLVPPTIERKDRERLVTVSGIVANGAALSEAVAAAEAAISSTEIPTELSVVIAGDYEDQQDMFADLLVLVVLMIVLVYMVMASQFEALMAPFVIMFSLPFALVGVFLGLELAGEALGVMALIGIIMLIGIVVKNGIVLIDYTILCRERGMNIRDASTTAARSRLRPILMTTLTTVLGMLPLAVSQGEGAEMWRPLGITVCWGLTISTLITLVLIPTLYCSLSYRMERRKKK